MAFNLFSILFFVFLIVLSCGFFYLAHRFIVKPFQFYWFYRSQGIPCMPFIPIVGNLSLMTSFVRDDHKVYFTTRMCRQLNSDSWVHFIGPICRLTVSDPLALNAAMHRENQQVFIKAMAGIKAFGPIFGSLGLSLIQNGPEHDWHRRMIAPAFRVENLKSMVDLIFDITSKNIHRFPDDDHDNNDGKQQDTQKNSETLVDLHHHFSTLALDILTTCVFGESVYKDSADKRDGRILYDTFTSGVQLAVSYFLSIFYLIPPLRFLKRDLKAQIDECSRKIDSLSNKLIAQRIAGKSKAMCKGKDLLDCLIEAEDDDGKKFSPEEIRDECRIFIFAGHETTANLLSWTMYLLGNHPEVLAKVRAEVDNFYEHHDRITIDNTNELEYLGAVLSESLRVLCPVPMLIREAACDTTLPTRSGKPIQVKKGTMVLLSVDTIHRNEIDWGEDAEEFKPERWLKSASAAAPSSTPSAASASSASQPSEVSPPSARRTGRHAASYSPFNMGMRNCIGQHFALQEGKIVAACFLRTFDFKLPPQKVFPVAQIPMRPKYGLKALLTKRQIQNSK